MKSLIPSFLIFAILVGLLVLDQFMGWGTTLFLMRKFAGLIDFLSFWR